MEARSNQITAIPEVFSALKQIVVEVAQLKIQPDQISDTSNLFNDCGVDSTAVVDLILSIEDRFQINIDEEELDVKLFQNLSALVSLVAAKLESGLNGQP